MPQRQKHLGPGAMPEMVPPNISIFDRIVDALTAASSFSQPQPQFPTYRGPMADYLTEAAGLGPILESQVISKDKIVDILNRMHRSASSTFKMQDLLGEPVSRSNVIAKSFLEAVNPGYSSQTPVMQLSKELTPSIRPGTAENFPPSTLRYILDNILEPESAKAVGNFYNANTPVSLVRADQSLSDAVAAIANAQAQERLLNQAVRFGTPMSSPKALSRAESLTEAARKKFLDFSTFLIEQFGEKGAKSALESIGMPSIKVSSGRGR